MMTKEERQAKHALVLKLGLPVRPALLTAVALGLVMLTRILAHACLKHLPLGPALFTGAFFLFLCWIGGFSLLYRFKLGFLALIVLALLPVRALLLLTDRFLELLAEDAFGNDWSLTFSYTAGFVQLMLTGLLLYFLFSKPARDHVWKPASAISPDEPPIRGSE